MLALALLLWSVDAPAKPYTIDTAGTTLSVRAGGEGRLALQIRPAQGYKVNANAPLKLALGGDRLRFPKAELKAGDATVPGDPAPAFRSAFSAATEPGETQLQVDANFFLCTDTVCERKVERVTLAVQIER